MSEPSNNEMQNKRLTEFKKFQEQIVAKNNANSNSKDYWLNRLNYHSVYTADEIQAIIESSNLEEKKKLSNYYFSTSGLYKQIILYYATLLNYIWLVLPTEEAKTIKEKKVQTAYYKVLELIDNSQIKDLCTNWSLKVLRDGAYYGVVTDSEDKIIIIDLPSGYCSSKYKDLNGNDLIEFDLSYFDTFEDKEVRNSVLASYPKIFKKYYKKWEKRKISKTIRIPSNMGICISLFDGSPLFLDTIPAILQYGDAVDIEQERDLEEIKKIIVQKVPHITSTGELVFEPVEAEEMHKGAVDMMKKNPNVSVLTTYADVDAIISKTSSDAGQNSLEKMQNNIYASCGVSGLIFSLAGSSTLKYSMDKDLSLMMILADKYSKVITSLINNESDVKFKFNFLPIAEYNKNDYIETAMKLGSTGYSWLIPSVAQGINQRDLISIKTLENDVLKLSELLIPLNANNSAQGENPVGRPPLKEEDKSAKTVKNEEAINNQGGAD